jgi:hypothetical protein
VAHVVLLALAARRVRSSRLAQLFLLVHGIGASSVLHRAGADASPDAPQPLPPTTTVDGSVLDTAPAPLSTDLARRLAHAAGQAVFLQAVALGGIVRYLRGDRPTRWTTVRR